jgi:hypothetical protein
VGDLECQIRKFFVAPGTKIASVHTNLVATRKFVPESIVSKQLKGGQATAVALEKHLFIVAAYGSQEPIGLRLDLNCATELHVVENLL